MYEWNQEKTHYKVKINELKEGIKSLYAFRDGPLFKPLEKEIVEQISQRIAMCETEMRRAEISGLDYAWLPGEKWNTSVCD